MKCKTNQAYNAGERAQFVFYYFCEWGNGYLSIGSRGTLGFKHLGIVVGVILEKEMQLRKTQIKGNIAHNEARDSEETLHSFLGCKGEGERDTLSVLLNSVSVTL